MHSIATVDDNSVKQFLQKKNDIQKTAVIIPGKIKLVAATSPVWKLTKENLEALQKFIAHLKTEGK